MWKSFEALFMIFEVSTFGAIRAGSLTGRVRVLCWSERHASRALLLSAKSKTWANRAADGGSAGAPLKRAGLISPALECDQEAAARGARLRELRWKNSAWLATAETIAGWNGFEIRNAGSGRSPVRKRSG